MDSLLNPPINPCAGCREADCSFCEEQAEDRAANSLFETLADYSRPEDKPAEEPAETSLFDEKIQQSIKNIDFSAMRIKEIAKEMKDENDIKQTVLSKTL